MQSIIILTIVLVTVCITVSHTASSLMLEEFDDPEEGKCSLYYCNDETQLIDIDCNCEDQCWREQKCCLNYLNNNNVNRSTYYFGIPKAHIERGQLFQCHVVNPHKTDGDSVISKCGTPNETSTESWQWQKSLCEQPIRPGSDEDYLLRIPVSSYETGETYKNIYCAACHDDLENITFWNTSVVCTDSRVTNVTQALCNLHVYGDDKEWPICELRVKPPPNFSRTHCTLKTVGYITQCPSSFLSLSSSPEDSDKRREIDWLCQVTSNPVNVTGTTYENPYCAACHFNETDIGAVISSKHGQCYPQTPELHTDGPEITAPTSKPYGVLLDFIPFSNNGNRVGVMGRCPPGNVYFGATEECKQVFPSKDYHDQPYEMHKEMSTTVGINDTPDHSPNRTTREIGVSALNCSFVQIDLSEAVINDNGTLIVRQEKLYPKGTFELHDNDTVNVCVDIDDNYVFDFKEIRKFPDKLVFCLCASLFIAQLLFLTPTLSATNYPVCALVGVLTHYFFLSSFTWMNVLAYDMWNTLSQCIQSRLIHSDILKRRFCFYSLYAWVTPMLIVSAACVFERSGIVDESSIMRPRYGVNLCWINTRTGLLFFFAIPMAVLLLANIAFFVITAVSICRSSFSMVQSRENRHSYCEKQRQSLHYLRYSIYVKLVAITGFSWTSGFVASVCGQDWLWYLFTLTSASQGVYILLALTPFKNVFQILRRRFNSEGTNSFRRHTLNVNRLSVFTQSEIVKSSLENIKT